MLSYTVCLSRFFTMFTCFAVNIMTLAAIGIDRYDAVCRAPVRQITCTKTTYGLIFIWLFACCTAVLGGTGHILTAVQGKHVCSSPERTFETLALTKSLWILPSLAVMFNRFFGIVKYVREHASYLRTILGTVGVQKEVKLTKLCVRTMIVTYLSLWIMFAVMVLLRNAFSSLAIHCAYLWAYIVSFF